MTADRIDLISNSIMHTEAIENEKNLTHNWIWTFAHVDNEP